MFQHTAIVSDRRCSNGISSTGTPTSADLAWLLVLLKMANHRIRQICLIQVRNGVVGLLFYVLPARLSCHCFGLPNKQRRQICCQNTAFSPAIHTETSSNSDT